MVLSFRSKSELLGGTIRWDYHLEALTEVLGGTIKQTYHLEVKAEVLVGSIRWYYLFKVKQRYQANLSDRIIILK